VLHTDDFIHVVLMRESSCALAVLDVLGMIVVSKSSESAMVSDSRPRSTTTTSSSPAATATTATTATERRSVWGVELWGRASKRHLERVQALLNVLRRHLGR
jgi:hypothetical protein